MSESTETTADPADAPEPPAPTPAPETAAASETPPSEAPGTTEPPAKEPPWFMKRINAMTREKAEATRKAETAERELAVYKALAEKNGAGQDEPRQQHQLAPRDDIDTLVEARLAQKEMENRRADLVAAGAKELGEEVWNDKTTVIASLGAIENPAFMQALLVVPDGHKVVAALADDPDRVETLLRMGPVQMAAEIGRLAAQLSAPKPATRRVSDAPKPGEPITGRQVPEPTVYDENISMPEYVKMRAKTAPPHLGGARRRA